MTPEQIEEEQKVLRDAEVAAQLQAARDAARIQVLRDAEVARRRQVVSDTEGAALLQAEDVRLS